jgi:hypothetical protein
MLLIPFLSGEKTTALEKHGPLLCFLSGSAALFHENMSESGGDLLLEPSSKDSASELLYSAAYQGIPDAQFLLAKWSSQVGAYAEALAWAEFVKPAERTDFLEGRYGQYASIYAFAIEQTPSFARAREDYVSNAKSRIGELKLKCCTRVSSRKEFIDFLAFYQAAVPKDTIAGLSWLGFQILAAHCGDAATLIFEAVERLAPSNAVANVFRSNRSLLTPIPSHREPDFDGLASALAPVIRGLGFTMDGVGWG